MRDMFKIIEMPSVVVKGVSKSGIFDNTLVIDNIFYKHNLHNKDMHVGMKLAVCNTLNDHVIGIKLFNF